MDAKPLTNEEFKFVEHHLARLAPEINAGAYSWLLRLQSAERFWRELVRDAGMRQGCAFCGLRPTELRPGIYTTEHKEDCPWLLSLD